jgi:protein-L-isoaspartate O-methyltransferase
MQGAIEPIAAGKGTTCMMPDVHARMLGALDPSPCSLTIPTHILGEIPDAGH